MSKAYKDININLELLEKSFAEINVTDLKKEIKKENHHIYKGTVDGEVFVVNIFIKPAGKITIGRAAGFSENAFAKVAENIVTKCGYSEKKNLEFSISLDDDQYQQTFDFLISLNSSILDDRTYNTHRQIKLEGPKKDTILIKRYNNKTFQAQGSNAHLASNLFDFLTNVIGLEDAIEKQKEVYGISLTKEEANEGLKLRIPEVYSYLHDNIRKQLSTAYTLYQVRIDLEDYANIPFGALRGLEGFCFQILKNECGFSPAQNHNLGDYFTSASTGFSYVLRYRDAVTDFNLRDLLESAYSMWHAQRHRLFHMDGTVETSVIIDSRQEACRITDDVFNLINDSYARYTNAKGRS